MIQTIACYISKWNKEKLGLSENERKVIEFGMEVFLDGCVKIIVLLSIAFLVLFVPFIGTVLTLLLATPVASDLRYAYPLILAAPFFIALPYCRLQTSRLQK